MICIAKKAIDTHLSIESDHAWSAFGADALGIGFVVAAAGFDVADDVLERRSQMCPFAMSFVQFAHVSMERHVLDVALVQVVFVVRLQEI